MIQKLGEIQENLLQYNFNRNTDYDTVLSTVRSELHSKKLTCWFNIIEGAIIFKIKSWNDKSDELNVRIPIGDNTDFTDLKLQLLQNTFCICKNNNQHRDSDEEEVMDLSTPGIIKDIVEYLKEQEIQTTRKNIAVELVARNVHAEERSIAKEFLNNFKPEEVVEC